MPMPIWASACANSATTMDVTVIAGEAVTGTITPVDEPEPIPHVDHRK
jgi:hypothetical protein